MNKISLFLLINLQLSCSILAPKYLADGLTVKVISKDQFATHTEEKLMTQIVRGTIHENVPTRFTYPCMNLVQLQTVDRKTYYVVVDEETFQSIKINSTIQSGRWKLITNLPNFQYSKTKH
ncbi:MAG: hypothetical protein WBO32_07125 [Cyclobacteriaceae bacterium]